MATILIADDNHDSRKMLQFMIENYTEHQAITADNGQACLAAAPRADLILMDIKMPEMNGFQTFQALRKNPETSEIPVIFMTAFPDQVTEMISSRKLGTIDYLLKPVAQEQLANRMKVMLGIRNTRLRFAKTNFSLSNQFILLLAALEQSADGITVTDQKGAWLMTNHAEANMFGYTPDEFMALKPGDIYSPESAEKLQTEVIKQLEENDYWEGELTGRKKNGETFPVLLSLSVVKDNSGHFIGIMGITKDISELKKAFADLKKAQEALIRSERLEALGEMSTGIAHDFNNLLAGILGNTELLLETVADPKERRRLFKIERAVQNAATALRRMQSLAYGKITTGPDSVDLQEILKEVIAAARPHWVEAAREKGVAIEVETHFNPVPPIRGDNKELKTALLNVLINAIESLSEGGRIRVRNWARGEIGRAHV